MRAPRLHITPAAATSVTAAVDASYEIRHRIVFSALLALPAISPGLREARLCDRHGRANARLSPSIGSSTPFDGPCGRHIRPRTTARAQVKTRCEGSSTSPFTRSSGVGLPLDIVRTRAWKQRHYPDRPAPTTARVRMAFGSRIYATPVGGIASCRLEPGPSATVTAPSDPWPSPILPA